MLTSREFPDTRVSLLADLGADAIGQSAWREFFERYGPAIYHVAIRRGLRRDDAGDIVQQVMIAIARHIEGFNYDRDRGRFRQWVRVIAENKIRDLHRKPIPATVEITDQISDQPTPDEIWDREWQMQDVLFCLDELGADFTPRRMEAFKLYVVEGLPAAEVAARLKMTVGHVYVTRTHVLNRLRTRLNEMEELDEDGH